MSHVLRFPEGRLMCGMDRWSDRLCKVTGAVTASRLADCVPGTNSTTTDFLILLKSW